MSATSKTITAGRIKVTINQNGEGDFFALATRDDRCLHGVPGRHYSSMKAAEKGAKLMIRKAS